MDLEAVDAAVARGDAGGALRVLLEAWWASGSARIADLIEVLPTPDREPLPGGPSPGADGEWHRVAAERDPLDIPRLLAVLVDCEPRQAAARVGALPFDPRVTTALMGLLRDPPFRTPHGKRFWTAVLEHLVDVREARVRPVLEGAAEQVAASVPGRMGVWLADRCERAAGQVPSREDGSLPAALVPVEVRLREALRRLRVARRDGADAAAIEADLLGAVYASPDDPGARAVYCDWLLEREDPRGAWMSAQLAAGTAPEIRETAVDSALRNRVLGGLAGTVTWATFANGFADAVGLWATNPSVPRSIGRAEWATVREVHAGPAAETPFVPVLREVLGHPVMRSLRVLRGPGLAVLEPLVEAGLRLDAVGVGDLGVDLGAGPRLAAFLEAARAAHLDLMQCVLAPTDLPHEALRGVRSLAVQTPHDLAQWLEHLDPTDVAVLLPAPTQGRAEAEWRFTRGADGRLSVLEVSPMYAGGRPPIRAWPTAPVVAALGALAGRLTAFRFTDLGPLPGFVRYQGRTRPIEDFERDAVLAAVPAGCAVG
ncbi:MAG: TIGR02996 domain-containing protein [Alphaproteobacteria bacterium]|nr:TIGR02996 domain-containing protein [Alphaproteobacteria bacterium]